MIPGFDEGQIIVHKLGTIESDIAWIKQTLIENEATRLGKIKSLEEEVRALKENQIKSRNFLAGVAAAASVVFSVLLRLIPWPS